MANEVRPWGSFSVLDEQPHYKVKRIVVTEGGRLSLQKHRYRCEHWTVVSGLATVTVGKVVRKMAARESVDIPLLETHRLENLDKGQLVVIEVQFGSYLGEDDIIRLDDVYGR